jgi:hypothetical protein
MQKPKKATVMIPNKEQITLIILQTTSDGSQQILALPPPQGAHSSLPTVQNKATTRGSIGRRNLTHIPKIQPLSLINTGVVTQYLKMHRTSSEEAA